MNRKLKLTVEIDYDKLMESKNYDIPKSYISEDEDVVIRKLVNDVAKISDAVKIEMVVEEEREKRYKAFERSGKMGSSCSHGYLFANQKETAEVKG